MANKNVVIIFKEGKLIPEAYTNIKDCVKAHGLSYWTIARLKSPISYGEYKIYRLPISIKKNGK